MCGNHDLWMESVGRNVYGDVEIMCFCQGKKAILIITDYSLLLLIIWTFLEVYDRNSWFHLQLTFFSLYPTA